MGGGPNDGPRAVLPSFETFQAARIEFAREVANLADAKGTHIVDGQEEVIGHLEASYHLLADMRPLVNDQSAAVRENAMLAMGKLANLSDKLHAEVSDDDTIAATISTISTGSTPALLKASLFLLHSMVKPEIGAATAAVERNALVALVERMEDMDAGTKQASIWCLAAIAEHEANLALAVADSGALPLLLQCLKEPSLPLRRVALACLGSVGKYSAQHAEMLQREGAISAALGLLTHRDMLLRRQACRVLACAVQHGGGASEWVPTEARKQLVQTMRDAASGGDGETGAFAATVLQQLAKSSGAVSTGLNDLGAVPVLVGHIAAGIGSPAPAAAALGHICDVSSDAATAAVEEGAIAAIKPFLASMAPVPVCAVLCASLGAIANAGEPHAATVATSGALQLMAEATVLSGRKMGPAALALARVGLSKALHRCAEYAVLVWLLESLPVSGPKQETQVLAALLKAMAKLLSAKGNLRLDFMQRGALTLAQETKAGATPELRDALKALNATYPSQMVAATDPNYETSLIAKIS